MALCTHVFGTRSSSYPYLLAYETLNSYPGTVYISLKYNWVKLKYLIFDIITNLSRIFYRKNIQYNNKVV